VAICSLEQHALEGRKKMPEAGQVLASTGPQLHNSPLSFVRSVPLFGEVVLIYKLARALTSPEIFQAASSAVENMSAGEVEAHIIGDKSFFTPGEIDLIKGKKEGADIDLCADHRVANLFPVLGEDDKVCVGDVRCFFGKRSYYIWPLDDYIEDNPCIGLWLLGLKVRSIKKGILWSTGSYFFCKNPGVSILVPPSAG
jgi:hypothetical protein